MSGSKLTTLFAILGMSACAAPEGEIDWVETGLSQVESTDFDVSGMADLLVDPKLIEDPEYYSEVERVISQLSEEERQLVADEVDRRLGREVVEVPPYRSSYISGEPIELYYGSYGKIATYYGTTTSCGGDVDAALGYTNVTNAYTNYTGLRAYESSLTLYSALRAAFGSALTSYRIYSDNRVYLCIGVGFSSSYTTATAVSLALIPNLRVQGY